MDYVPLSSKTLSVLDADPSIAAQLARLGKVAVSRAEGGLELDGEGGDEWIARQVVSALDVGFPLQKAFKLFNDNFFLEVVDLELAVRNPKSVKRFKGRIIGEGGRAKKTIEELSGAYLSVSGGKVFILGQFDDLQLAKEAVLRLLEGRMHSTVFAFLERQNKLRKYSMR
ncbi:MAG: KH domain-containing protein [Candidatus Micrarchaeota archaeon]